MVSAHIAISSGVCRDSGRLLSTSHRESSLSCKDEDGGCLGIDSGTLVGKE